jgi:hypothetical protein
VRAGEITLRQFLERVGKILGLCRFSNTARDVVLAEGLVMSVDYELVSVGTYLAVPIGFWSRWNYHRMCSLLLGQ